MSTTSIKEVARRAGVSVGTVSNVLNRPDIVRPEKRQRVLAAIHELGFVRNESARQLRAGRSRTIGLVVLDVANPFFTDVARGAELAADEHNLVVVLCDSGGQKARESRYLDHFEAQRVLGVLITPVDTDGGRLDRLARLGVPVVLVDRQAGDRGGCSVAVDDVGGGRLAATHLLDQGHRRLAYVGGPRSTPQVADRRLGATRAVATVPGADLRVFETPSLTFAAGRAAGDAVATMSPADRPTAVFCANDLLALGVLQAFTRHGVRVPGDVALIGYDDIEFAAAAAVPLSSIRQPREHLGRSAAELLLAEAFDGVGHQHRQVVFEPELVVRASTAAPEESARGGDQVA